MYFGLNGEIKEIFDNFIIIENNGIEYQVFVSHPEIFKQKEKIHLFLYNSITQTEQQLIGFKTLKEKDFFLILISTKGIGIKKALRILNKINYDVIEKLSNENSINIINEEIGKIKTKNVENIIDKFKKQKLINNNQKYKKILIALKKFGFKSKEIKPFLTNEIINSNNSDEEIIKKILKNLGKKFENEYKTRKI